MAVIKYGLFSFTNTVDIAEMNWVTTQFSTWEQYYQAQSVHIEWPVLGKIHPCDGRLLLVNGIIFFTYLILINNIIVLTDDREVLKTIRDNYMSRKLTLEQVVQWQTLPEGEVAVVSCDKRDRKFRAKRGHPDEDEQPDGLAIRKEKREKKDLKADATKKKQELLKDAISAVYKSSRVSSCVS